MSVDQDPTLTKPARINPYRYCLGLIVRRMKWDFNYKSWTSRRRLNQVKNKFKNEKCVILCNGPSLLNVDFDSLKDSGVFSIGLNKINLLFEKSDFRPNCIVAVNKLVIEQNREFFNETEIPLYLSSYGRQNIEFRKNVSFLHPVNIPMFARDCAASVYTGFTVTYVAMQIAFHLGFSKVALVGCDHSFATKGYANMTVKSGDEDHSHFDKRYFSKGVKWQLPDLEGSEYAYAIADRTYTAFGRKIFNSTDGGKLEVFRRMDLKDFLQS